MSSFRRSCRRSSPPSYGFITRGHGVPAGAVASVGDVGTAKRLPAGVERPLACVSGTKPTEAGAGVCNSGSVRGLHVGVGRTLPGVLGTQPAVAPAAEVSKSGSVRGLHVGVARTVPGSLAWTGLAYRGGPIVDCSVAIMSRSFPYGSDGRDRTGARVCAFSESSPACSLVVARVLWWRRFVMLI